jgi:hypothetical protein
MEKYPRRLTKEELRDLLREQRERRENAAPEHKSPSWVARFWRLLRS